MVRAENKNLDTSGKRNCVERITTILHRDGCAWHTRGTRSELEQIRNDQRGQSTEIGRCVVRGHTAKFWCSCKSASKASLVFSDLADATWRDHLENQACTTIVKRWTAALDSLDIPARWARLVRGLVRKERPTERPTVKKATGSVPLPQGLPLGVFVGKRGARITSLQLLLNRSQGATVGRGHYNRRVVLSVKARPLHDSGEITFVCPEKRFADVQAKIQEWTKSVSMLQQQHVNRKAQAQGRALQMSIETSAPKVHYSDLTMYESVKQVAAAKLQKEEVHRKRQPKAVPTGRWVLPWQPLDTQKDEESDDMVDEDPAGRGRMSRRRAERLRTMHRTAAAESHHKATVNASTEEKDARRAEFEMRKAAVKLRSGARAQRRSDTRPALRGLCV